MSTRTKAILLLCGLGLLALIVIPMFSSNSPKEWLDDNYATTSGSDPKKETVVYRSEDDVDQTVNAIIAGTDPDDTDQQSVPADATADSTVGEDGEIPVEDGEVPADAGENVVLLRYGSDWIVTVRPDSELENAGGARVELDEFDRGYDRLGGVFFLGMWNSHYKTGGFGSSFRGGGSGFGK